MPADRPETVGLVGVGLVGLALARRLLAGGYAVAGYDIDDARLRLLAAAGGECVRSPAEVAARARRVVLALFDTATTRLAVEGADGLLRATPAPRYLIDTSTGDPEDVAALAARLATLGTRYVDAPLSGSSAQIERGEAVTMAGGEAADLDACADLLAACGGRVFRVGGPGAGMKAKLATNVIVGLNRAALAEGLACARALGLDLGAFLAVAKATPAHSTAMDVKGERMVEGRYTPPESRIRQHRKDVEMILRLAGAAGQRLPLSDAHLALLSAAVDAGDGDLDNAAVFRRYDAP